MNGIISPRGSTGIHRVSDATAMTHGTVATWKNSNIKPGGLVRGERGFLADDLTEILGKNLTRGLAREE